ncbi:MAG: DUF4340 domain-containing protein [Planctomycetota bacterium]
MSLRTTLILLLLCALTTYWVETREAGRRAYYRFGADQPYGGLSADFFQRITVRRGEHRIVLESRDSGWRLTEPVDYGTHWPTVEHLLRTLQQLRIRAEISAEHVRHGFTEQSLRVEFEDRQNHRYELTFGNDVDQVDKPLVYLRYDAKLGACDREVRDLLQSLTVNMLRDDTLCDIPPARAVAFELRRAGSDPLEFNREPDGRWSARSPFVGDAAAAEIVHMISIINAWSVAEFVRDDVYPGTAAAAAFGLEQPAAELVVSERGGRQVRLWIGAAAPADEKGRNCVYVAWPDRTQVVSVLAEPLVLFEKPADYYRSRQWIDLAEPEVTELTIQNHHGNSVVTLSTKGVADLRFGADSTRYAVEPQLLRDLTEALRATRLTHFAGKLEDLRQHGFDQPLRVVLKTAGGRSESASIGDLSSEGNNSYHVLNDRWDYSGLASLPYYELLSDSPYSLRALRVIDDRLLSVATLRMSTPEGRLITFDREETGWRRRTRTNAQLPIDPLNPLTTALGNLVPEEWRAAETLTEIPGPDFHELQVELSLPGSDRPESVFWIGQRGPDGTRWVRDGDRGWVFKLAAESDEPSAFNYERVREYLNNLTD